MIDDWLLSLAYAAWLAASTMPLGLMLGSSCSPCCRNACGDFKPVTDPASEGTWVPAGDWDTGVTWSFVENPGDNSGETWFFFGSAATSRLGGGATTAQQRDWNNLCNWYSRKSTSPSTSIWPTNTANLTPAQLTATAAQFFTHRASRLPPSTAVVHLYTQVSTLSAGPQTVKTAYGWAARWENETDSNQPGTFHSGTLSATSAAHGTDHSIVLTRLSGVTVAGYWVAAGATLSNVLLINSQNFGTITDATFKSSINDGVVNGGAEFYQGSNRNTVNGGANFFDNSVNGGIVNGGAAFNQGCRNSGSGAVVNDGAIFNANSTNSRDNLLIENREGGVVNGGAVFNDTSRNAAGNFTGIINGLAVFNDNSANAAEAVNDGAVFNDSAVNEFSGRVNNGATFNDAACSRYFVGSILFPCTKRFVVHPTDLPACNGTAPAACSSSSVTCGCG